MKRKLIPVGLADKRLQDIILDFELCVKEELSTPPSYNFLEYEWDNLSIDACDEIALRYANKRRDEERRKING